LQLRLLVVAFFLVPAVVIQKGLAPSFPLSRGDKEHGKRKNVIAD
jgi:hypothetical protein